MNEKLQDQLDAIFSLLPPAKAHEAKQKLLQHYQDRGDIFSEELPWADFDPEGKFLGGGITNVAELSTAAITSSQEHPRVDELSRLAREGADAGFIAAAADARHMNWFLPYSRGQRTASANQRIRGLSISLKLFAEVLHLFNKNKDLGAKEIRTAFQLVLGFSLRKAAAEDGVAYETKRAHVKNICAKLSCSGQKELVALLLGQLVHLLTLSNADIIFAETAQDYVARFMADDFRLTVKRLPNGRLIRLLESGPQDGKTMVMVHGLMFPVAFGGIAAHLAAAGIRLIIPVRTGYLENRPVSALFDGKEVMDAALEDLALFLSQETETPAVLLGNSLGAVVAIRFANRFPQLVSRLVLLSINLTRTQPTDENFAGEFYGGMRDVADEPELFRLVNWQFREYYADENTCRDILMRLFGGSETDIAVLEGEINGSPAYTKFSQLYQTSIAGVAEDFGFVMNKWQEEVSSLQTEVTFIHGTEDPLTEISELEVVAGPDTNNRIVSITGGGHFISVSHAQKVWGEIADLAQAD